MFNVGDRFLYKCDLICNGNHPTWNCKGGGYRLIKIEEDSYYIESNQGNAIHCTSYQFKKMFVQIKKVDTFGYTKGLRYV